MPIPQKHRQDDDHQHAAFDQITGYSATRTRDHFALVVKRLEAHARRQALGNFLDALLDLLSGFRSVGTFEKDDHPGHALSCTVASNGAVTRHCAEGDGRQVAEVNRATAVRGNHDALEIAGSLQQTAAADRQALRPAFHKASSEHGVAVADRTKHVRERQVELVQQARVDLDLEAFVSPPHEFTSLTPRTERSRRRISQSCSALRSMASRGPSTKYWYTSPKGVATGPRLGARPAGKRARTSAGARRLAGARSKSVCGLRKPP